MSIMFVPALLAIVNVAVYVPAAEGTNSTLNVALAPGAIVAPSTALATR
jgi:hypothetical protein